MKKFAFALATAAVGSAFSSFAEDPYIESDGMQAINTGYYVNRL